MDFLPDVIFLISWAILGITGYIYWWGIKQEDDFDRAVIVMGSSLFGGFMWLIGFYTHKVKGRFIRVNKLKNALKKKLFG